MATKKRKKEYTKEDALAYFEDVLQRSDLQNFLMCGDDVYSWDDDGHHTIIIMEKNLLNDMDPNRFPRGKGNETNISFLYDCSRSLKEYEDWIPIELDPLYSGDTVYLKMGDRELKFNKGLLPMRLRKAEFNNISYAIQLVPYPILAVKKYFPSKLDGYGFTLMKVFKIL